MEIAKRSEISYEEFIEEYYKPGIPVVFKNASKVWAANGLFTPEWFRDNYADRTTTVNGVEYTMLEVMDLVATSTKNNPAPYPCIFDIPSKLPELLPLLQPLHLNFAVPNWFESKWFSRGKWGNATEVFIGGPGGKFPYLHLDYYHLSAWITQLYGEKQFTVFPREQENLLYADPQAPWKSPVDIFEPDYVKFPKYKDATPIHFTVGPGETLYIPFGIWHTAHSLTPTISVAFDQLSGINHKKFIKDIWAFKKHYGLARTAARCSYAWLASKSCQLEDSLGMHRSRRQPNKV